MVSEQFRAGSPITFLYLVKHAAEYPDFSVGDAFGLLSNIRGEQVLAGYTAPFPDDNYIAGVRKFLSCVPLLEHHQADCDANDRAWAVLEAFDRPLLTAFSDGGPVTKGGEAEFQQRVPGAESVKHTTNTGGRHFLQEDQPEQLSHSIITFMRD
ncbi:hypothetical protein [Erythrobacter sp.]|uniref:hypothetical protein n=1 Tax=Erythrobacter sp. TaxID=1042 RepID=UPI00311F9165